MPPGRDDPCPCGSGRKYKRCHLEADRAQVLPSAAAAAWAGEPGHPKPEDGAGMVTLIVETPAGIVLRRIPNAMALPTDIERGEAAEEAVHDAAAIWGLPDFTFRGRVVSVGSGAREIGDNLVVVGDAGLVVQVKSRTTPTADPDRERGWIEKKVNQALDQARGSIRRLKRGPVELTNARGRTIEVDGAKVRWLSVVVVDYPGPAPDVPARALDPAAPVVVMLRRDWDFLFDQMKSTHAVVAYLERVAGDPVPLGDEPARYYQLAVADHEAEPTGIDPALVGDGRVVSVPLLPLVAHPEDARIHLLVRSIFEDIAIAPAPRSTRLTASRFSPNSIDSLSTSAPTSVGFSRMGWRRRSKLGRTPAG
jgi:hypothetical protein